VSDQQSLGSMLSGLAQDLSALVRGEIELVKTELRQSARTAAAGGGMLAAALVVAGTAALFLLLTLAWVLSIWLPVWAGFGIVTLLLIIVAAILFVVGRKQLENVKGPEVAQRSIERTKAMFTGQPDPGPLTPDPAAPAPATPTATTPPPAAAAPTMVTPPPATSTTTTPAPPSSDA